MTTKQRPHVTLEHPGELLASVPHLLGFHPSDSLVVLGLRGTTTASVGVVLRADLPPPDEIRALAEYLLLPLTQHNAESVVLVVVGGRAPVDDLPDRELLARCESVLVDAGFTVAHQLWTPDTTAGRRWRCYDDFKCIGVLPDPGGTDLAKAAKDTGLVTYASRDEIVATLAPEPDDVLARRSAAFDRRTDATEPDHGTGPPKPDRDQIRAWLDAVRRAIESAVATPPTLTDDDVVQLIGALSEHRVRDVNLDFDRLPDVAAAERLWTALARATPAPERAEPACLLAFSAYARGDGVLAGIALANAEAADPGHRLTNLLRSALTLGLEPGKIRVAGIRAATFARQSLNEDLAQPEES